MTDTKPVRCAIYARVSTADQVTVPAQLEALREYASRRGWVVVQEVGEVRSGAKHRPKRQELMAAARARQIDAVVVMKLDRWGRSLADLIGTMDELTKLGVAFVSVTDSIDLTTPTGRLLAGVLAAVAAFERDLVIERTKFGLAHARRHGTRSQRELGAALGKAIGRPAVAAERAVEVRALRHRGLSLTVIAERVGLSYGSVQRLLANVPRKPK
jgi:DNA invertase Pin-like site-specific DNA recombinase